MEAAQSVTMNNSVSNYYITTRLCCSLFAALFFLGSCTPGQPALSEAARAFKKEALETIKLLAPEFTGLIAQNNRQALDPALDKKVSAADRAGTPLKFKVTILDRMGIKVAGGYRDVHDGTNFSGYTAAQTVLQQGKMASGVLYSGGVKIYIIGAPLVHEGTVVGALVLGVLEPELKDQWHVTEKEFREMDFN
jgi:hypothetical protein